MWKLGSLSNFYQIIVKHSILNPPYLGSGANYLSIALLLIHELYAKLLDGLK